MWEFEGSREQAEATSCLSFAQLLRRPRSSSSSSIPKPPQLPNSHFFHDFMASTFIISVGASAALFFILVIGGWLYGRLQGPSSEERRRDLAMRTEWSLSITLLISPPLPLPRTAPSAPNRPSFIDDKEDEGELDVEFGIWEGEVEGDLVQLGAR
ncbi:hypothetical protein BDY24DRAFT_437346 [Mrakia frigida]|uniref:uncharacterized protein n=1 Tax=Mrakia frigida TaxID=29902 RepID=UPI003FCC00CF